MSALQYIGSRISLISKADIRYEGILHEVDAKASTVSLGNVRIWGTEDRRKKNDKDYVAPADQLFECVVFRASDIKDLTVKEAPPKKPEQAKPSVVDPAIVSSTKPAATNATANANVATNSVSAATKPTAANVAAVQRPVAALARPTPTPASTITPSQSNAFIPPARNTLNDLNTGIQSMSINKQPPAPVNGHAVNNVKDTINEPKPARDFLHQKPLEKESHGTREFYGAREGIGYNSHGNIRGGRGGRGGYYRGRGGHNYNQGIVVPRADFDIQSSNAKFDREDLASENPELVADVQSTVYYNKSMSFFDNISCEAKNETTYDPNSGPVRNRENYQLNMETFGRATSGSNYRHRGGRGRGRGYGGRPRYQQHQGAGPHFSSVEGPIR